MVKMLNLAMLALVMLPLYARCDPSTKAEEPSVFVGGGVQKPGRYDWFKGMTVLGAIQAAGGLIDRSAATVRVTITHADQAQVVYAVGPGADTAKKPPVLQAGDRVFVPKKIKPAPVMPPPPKPAN
ncbi:MAG TPA: SLBB domain-containing protein [Verrucomicrobiae bacterium]|jgi:protein involved in polysaccharide export with SLBB domain|nr:SLBB domain-containing protein [Verrucomicrobiae bacterium]